MSTCAYVGYLTKSGSFKYIYVHNDGYISGVGQTLLNHYDLKKTRELIKLGSASCIYKNLNPTEGSGHYFYNREKDVCVFYGRDRKDSKADSKASSMKKLKLEVLLDGVRYVYVIDQKGVWYVNNEDNTKLVRLDSHPEIKS